MTARRISTCGQCRAAIVWGRTPAGKSMPLDAEPNPAGNVAAYRDVLRAQILGPGDPMPGFMRRYMPHFATCAPVVAHRQGVRDGTVVELARRQRGRTR